MIFTNKFDLPDAIFQAVANDPYSKGKADYSITGLLKPPRIAALERLYADQIEEDVSDRIFSLIGQAIHGILERSERIAITEQRLYCEIDNKILSGQTDRFVVAEGLLQDFKVTSLWKVVKEVDQDWIAQQNCYRYLLHKNGYECDKLQIVAILRDWSKAKAYREEDYPVAQIKVVPLPVWPLEKTESFIRHRIAMHEAAKLELPLCTNEDRWATPDTWAVKKPGGKRALRVFTEYLEAKNYLLAHGDNLEIELRRSQNKRCESYCLVKGFCDQFKELSGGLREGASKVTR